MNSSVVAGERVALGYFAVQRAFDARFGMVNLPYVPLAVLAKKRNKRRKNKRRKNKLGDDGGVCAPLHLACDELTFVDDVL